MKKVLLTALLVSSLVISTNITAAPGKKFTPNFPSLKQKAKSAARPTLAALKKKARVQQELARNKIAQVKAQAQAKISAARKQATGQAREKGKRLLQQATTEMNSLIGQAKSGAMKRAMAAKAEADKTLHAAMQQMTEAKTRFEDAVKNSSKITEGLQTVATKVLETPGISQGDKAIAQTIDNKVEKFDDEEYAGLKELFAMPDLDAPSKDEIKTSRLAQAMAPEEEVNRTLELQVNKFIKEYKEAQKFPNEKELTDVFSALESIKDNFGMKRLNSILKQKLRKNFDGVKKEIEDLVEEEAIPDVSGMDLSDIAYGTN